jgi:hypothetical protein
MSYLLEPMTEPLTIEFDLNGRWPSFGKLVAVWRQLWTAVVIAVHWGNLVVKQDSRLRTKLDLHVRHVICVY